MYFKMTDFLYTKIIFVLIVIYSETISNCRAQQLDLEEGKIVYCLRFKIISTRILTENGLVLDIFFLFDFFCREINNTVKMKSVLSYTNTLF